MHVARKTLIAAAAIAAVAAPAAQADTDTTSITLQGTAAPTLSAPAIGDFGTVNLTGERLSARASVSDWSVTDATGSGNGWTVQESASVPENADSSRTLATAVLNVSAPTVAAADNQNGSAAPSVAGGNLLDGVTSARAGAGAGMGKWNFSQGPSDLELVVPSDAYADTYTSTITTTLSAGL